MAWNQKSRAWNKSQDLARRNSEEYYIDKIRKETYSNSPIKFYQ